MTAAGATTATVTVAADGMVTVVCSCGDVLESGGAGTDARRALQHLTVHVQLHATAAAADVPWPEVQERQRWLRRGHRSPARAEHWDALP